MHVRLTKGAKRDLADAIEEYEDALKGLGSQFQDAVESNIDEIAEHPLRWPMEYDDIHRFLMRRFPYKIIYQLRDGALYVLAVMHTSRRPGYWKSRVTKK